MYFQAVKTALKTQNDSLHRKTPAENDCTRYKLSMYAAFRITISISKTIYITTN